MIRRVVLLLSVLAACGCDEKSAPPTVARAPMTDKFNGTYSGEGVTLTLKSDGAAYHGTATLNGETFGAHAGVSEQALHGVFISGGNQYSWSATGDADALVFKSRGKPYKLTRDPTVDSGGTSPPQ